MMRIACYGEGLIDFTQQGNAFVPHPGGSPYNVAVALARLGCRTEFCSQLSTDMFGQQLVDYLQQNNVGTSHILRSQAPSTLAFVATPENAEPEYAFFSQGAADVIPEPGQPFPQPEADYHHFGSISLMQEPCGSFWEKYLTKRQGFISFDPNIRSSLIPDRSAWLQRLDRILEYTSLLRLSIVDLQWIDPDSSVEKFARRILERGVKMVAVTAGEQGAHLFTRQHTLHQPAASIQVIDTIGAGDTFTAGFLSVLSRSVTQDAASQQLLLAEALKAGCLAAALNCRQKGANPPDRRALEQAMRQ
ncbi:carbohydrate kinase family protein [Tatumella citrea]|nr:carbohydrate kinase [Tatumella citrea]